MAVKYWDGTGAGHTGDWQWDDSGAGYATSNWKNAAGTGVAKPVADDVVIFDGRSSQAVTDGVAVGETGGVSLDLLHVKSTFTANIGTSSERVHINPDRVIFEGTGTMYLECSAANATTDSDIDLVIVNSVGGTLYLTSDVNTASWCAEFTKVFVAQGTLYVGDTNIDTFVRELWMAPKNNESGKVAVYVKEDCIRSKTTAANMKIYMLNGTITCDSAVDEIIMADGTFTYGSDLGASPETGMDIAKLTIYGGHFDWQPDDTGDPYIGESYLFGGTLDASSTTNYDRAKVLGNGALKDVLIFAGATLNIANGKGNITVAASSKIRNFGGTFVCDQHTAIAPTYDQT